MEGALAVTLDRGNRLIDSRGMRDQKKIGYAIRKKRGTLLEKSDRHGKMVRAIRGQQRWPGAVYEFRQDHERAAG